MIKTDIAIVGAGPAGLTCARLAAAAGLSVIVLEAQSFPPRKTCAGGLTERSLNLLPNKASSAIQRSLKTAIYRALGQTTFRFKCESPYVHTVDRGQLLLELAEAATRNGARVCARATAVSVKRIGSWNEVVGPSIGKVKARIVVGCYGARPAAKLSFIQRELSLTRAAIAGFVRSHSLPSLHEDTQTVDCMLTRTGLLLFAFPMSGGYQVGVLTLRPSPTYPSLFQYLQKAADSYIAGVLGISREANFYPGWLPATSKWRYLSAPGQILCGDAAGLCDPLFGEGIYFALRSGEIAAWCAEDALNRGDLSLKSYSAEVRREYQQAFWWLSLGRTLFLHWPAAVSRVLTNCTRAQSLLVDYMRNFQSWSSFRSLPVLCLPHLLGIPMPGYSFLRSSCGKVTVEKLGPCD